MKIIGIEHIGIAVNQIDKDALFWKKILGLREKRVEIIKDQLVKTDIYETGRGKIELLEAMDSNSPINKFIQKKGPGVHHICFEVEDIHQAIKELKKAQVVLINDEPKIGAEGHKIVFVHPKSTGGVLVELAQKV